MTLTVLTRQYSSTVRYTFAVLAVFLAFVLREALASVLGSGVPFILFYPTVVLIAWFGGLWPGLLATGLSGIIAWYNFFPPHYSFAVSDPTAAAQLIVFLLAATLISLLGETLHRAMRQAQERALREREQREQFRITLESIGDAVIATDVKGRITFLNPVAESLTGWSRQEASDRPLDQIFNVVNETTREPVENPAFRAIERGVVVGLANHAVLIARDGSEYAIDDSAAPIATPETGISGAVLVFRDITQRRTIEREISESRERLRITLGSIGDAVVATDPEGRITYVNSIAEKLLGYHFDQARGKRLIEIFNIVNEFTREAVENPVERVLREGNIVGLANHTILLRPDGGEMPIDDSAAPIHNDSGHIAGVVLVFRDISERRRAQRTQATLAAIVESSDDAIVSKDLQGRIMTWNAGAERLFGYCEEEVVGHPITMIIPPDRLEEEAAILHRLRNGERLEHYETVRVRKDGKPVDISLSVSPVRAPDGAILGASKIARDISERKRIEQQLAEADRRKDNFLAVLAHELRNPLSPIRNAVKILEIDHPNDRDLVAYCDLIDKEVMQINRLLDDLLDLSRITTGKFSLRKERIDLATIVNSAVETSRGTIEQAGHQLKVSLAPGILIVEADPMRMAQVFSNLLNNAAKFTDPGGDIRVETARRDGQVRINVKDSGIGIGSELMPKIFDMFVQGDSITERTHGGLGLGLTLARDIVELHGGTIEATSVGAGQGSEFSVCLPLADVMASTAVPDSRQIRLSPDGQLRSRIVVVDDNKNQALSLQRLLERIGHEVRVTYDGSSAMKLLASFVPDFALIDIGLPRINGYELARWLRQQPQLRKITLIAQTGWGREEDRKQAHEAGFDHHLVKPIDYQRLMQILTKSGLPPA